MELADQIRQSISGYKELMVLLEEASRTASMKSPEELVEKIQEITTKQDAANRLQTQIMCSLRENMPKNHADLIEEWYQTLKKMQETNEACIPVLKTQQSLLAKEMQKIKHGMNTLSAYNTMQA